jgi:hypothetical protein
VIIRVYYPKPKPPYYFTTIIKRNSLFVNVYLTDDLGGHFFIGASAEKFIALQAAEMFYVLGSFWSKSSIEWNFLAAYQAAD